MPVRQQQGYGSFLKAGHLPIYRFRRLSARCRYGKGFGSREAAPSVFTPLGQIEPIESYTVALAGLTLPKPKTHNFTENNDNEIRSSALGNSRIQFAALAAALCPLQHPGSYLTGSLFNHTGLPQAKSFPTHLLSPRDESNKGQARKKERIDLRLRDDSDSNDLPRVIDAGGLV